jgi:FkbM family methyltransferase
LAAPIVQKEILISILTRVIRKLRFRIASLRRIRIGAFLKKVPGVIHIGANTGQERNQYASLGLNVLWVEAIPEVFNILRSNISGFPKQRAYCKLLAAEHGEEYTFHIANNKGASSSIFDLAKHREIWPAVKFTNEIHLTATTLTRLIEDEQIDLRNFGALVLDTQGSELMVLRGAIPVLKQLQFVKTEAADFESYAGGCRLAELTEFMRQQGFAFVRKSQFATTPDGLGAYYEVLYRRL